MKTKILNTLLLTTLIGFSLGASAERLGGQDSNGGGGICDKSGCKTLAQAGFRVGGELKTENGFRQGTRAQVIGILQDLPFGFDELLLKQWQDGIIDAPDQFVLNAKVPSAKLQVYKNRYLEILRQNPNSLDTKGFQLFAYSDRSKTYLLPAFNGLSDRGQALILFHENFIRQGVPLEDVIRFDGYLADYLDHMERNDLANFDVFTFKEVGLSVGFRQGDESFLGPLIQKNGGSLSYSAMCDVYNRTPYECFIPREKALQLRSLHPHFVERFSGKRIRIFEYEQRNFHRYTNKDLQRLDPRTFDFAKKGCAEDPNFSDKVFFMHPSGEIFNYPIRILCAGKERL